ncbi:fumarylacetoacetate hydrolase family protein [Neobacillus cucumis]|uniref:fumarylacetoacetate hydrolase family protein n=1 Tax=Neobacillus cucumis TaxID=1740721 RepID=UPI00203EEB43|nr:fumarylacetoacetate hydrolase family protein [Neobacillus cucumis]MCM3728160.1 fumarylacetoacetate hydrolase family protein [Neobacillus cucumis]
MKLLNFQRDNQIRLGVKTEQGIIDVQKVADALEVNIPCIMEDVIAGGSATLSQLQTIIEKTEDFISEEGIQYAPVVTKPEKIICVGLNYINHAEESKMAIPTSPVLFNKFNNSLAAHQDQITLPKGAEKFDYEAELVIVIGKETNNISEQDALTHVFGYTVGNDVSARDLQFRTPQWLLGKALDQFAPIGPYLVTADEVDDPTNLDIKCKVNGELRQSANTRDMIFSCATIVSYISKYITLQPGDLIFSGTPDGVILGYPEDKQVWLKSGDEMTVSIEKIGTLNNVLT